MKKTAKKATAKMTLREFYAAQLEGVKTALADDTMTEEKKWRFGITEDHAREIEDIIRKIDNGEIENSTI